MDSNLIMEEHDCPRKLKGAADANANCRQSQPISQPTLVHSVSQADVY